MKIFGWSASVRDGCWFYRMKMPLDELAKHGHETRVGVVWAYDHGWDKPDIVVGQRICQDGPSKTWQKRSDIYRVYELDDDLLNLDPSNPGYAFYEQAHIRANLKRNIQCADAVTVSTMQLAELVSKLNPRVYIVPNTVPKSLLEFERTTAPALTVGWAGSATHDMDWKEVSPHVKRFLHRNRDVQFHDIGEAYGSRFGLDGRYRHTPWTDTVGALWSAIDFDIGLAPLRDHRFNRSKSPLKALEYAALGIPVIASDVGPYREFVAHYETGYLVKKDYQWGHYLHALARDPFLRKDMGRAARNLAWGYIIENWWTVWEAAYGAGGFLSPKMVSDAKTPSNH